MRRQLIVAMLSAPYDLQGALIAARRAFISATRSASLRSSQLPATDPHIFDWATAPWREIDLAQCSEQIFRAVRDGLVGRNLD